MEDASEFAELYTTSERVRFVVFGLVAGLSIVGIGRLWLFPWLHDIAGSPQCWSFLGQSGGSAVMYGLLVGLPALAGFVVACTLGPRGFRILRDGQAPPRGEKSFRLTRIRRGTRATLIGYLHIIALVPFIALSVWGYTRAAALSSQAQGKRVDCPASHALRPKPLAALAVSTPGEHVGLPGRP